MLKIYRKTVIHEIHNHEEKCTIAHSSFYTIEDEDNIQPIMKEYSLYSDEAKDACFDLYVDDSKRGRVARAYAMLGCYKFEQWKKPDAKLIKYVHYKEQSCSMKELWNLNANKVIAYLKQEGINLSLTN